MRSLRFGETSRNGKKGPTTGNDVFISATHPRHCFALGPGNTRNYRIPLLEDDFEHRRKFLIEATSRKGELISRGRNCPAKLQSPESKRHVELSGGPRSEGDYGEDQAD